MGRLTISTAGAALALALSPAAAAQVGETLEQTYARLCSGSHKSETCDVLLQAMLKKREGSASTQQGASTPSSKAADTREFAYPEWGDMNNYAGRATITDFGTSSSIVYHYWSVPGSVMIAEVASITKDRWDGSIFRMRLTLNPASGVITTSTNDKYYVQSDGSISIEDAFGNKGPSSRRGKGEPEFPMLGQTSLAAALKMHGLDKKKSGGRSWGRLLSGALSGATAMVNAGGGQSEALAGAAIGAVAGAQGLDSGSIGTSMGTAAQQQADEMNARDAAAQAQLNATIAQAAANQPAPSASSPGLVVAERAPAAPPPQAAPVVPSERLQPVVCKAELLGPNGGLQGQVWSRIGPGFTTQQYRHMADVVWPQEVKRMYANSTDPGCFFGQISTEAELEQQRETARRNRTVTNVDFLPTPQ